MEGAGVPKKKLKTMPLTAAEKSKRYRERLRQDNPEKFQDLQKKNSERSKQLYKTKTAILTEEQKEERRVKWRELNKQRGQPKTIYKEQTVSINITHTEKSQMPLTAAEKSKRYRERLRQDNPEKFKDLKKKNSERSKQLYKTKTAIMTEEQKEERREKWRILNKQRARSKITNTEQTVSINTTLQKTSQDIARNIQRKIECNLRKENLQLRNSILALQKCYNHISKQLKVQQQEISKMKEDYEILMKKLE